MKLQPVIGLEIHVQLKTKSKMFCNCDNSGEDKPLNSCICEICMGHPGTLPYPNRTAIEWAIKTALALNCKIPNESKFDRKHYFYPDLPKGYQISQYDKPFGQNGFLEIETEDGKKKIRINRLHLEEDAAKLLHKNGCTVVDYNRAGTPLIEIVTEPDIHNPKTAEKFLKELKLIMRILEVSNADMEKGQLRCDANISLKEYDKDVLNPKTEIKNLNSFKSVRKALEYEIKRQKTLWEKGTPPQEQSTRGWDEEKEITVEQRTKEEAHDYRYFPEPDIPPIILNDKSIKNYIDTDKIKNSIPELPIQKRERFIEQYNFSPQDAYILTKDYNLANYTEKVMSELEEWMKSQDVSDELYEKQSHKLSRLAANWLINNLIPILNKNWNDLKITPENFAEFISILAQGKISSKAGQAVLKSMFKTGRDPEDIIKEEKLEQIGESDELKPIVEHVIKDNPKVVLDYKSGKENSIKFLIGAVMKETKGRANPQIAEKILKELLKNNPINVS